jgi:phage terminase large subunit-like protein
MMATLVNGSEILFRSTDSPDRLRGPNLHWWFGDESAMYDKEVWPIMIGRLRADGRAGMACLATTPRGRNWLYERQNEMTMFRARTRDNPYLDREFIESLEASYTGSFARQELEGEFVSYEGLVYEDFDRGKHVTERHAEWKRIVVGVDEGYTNPAVLLVVGEDNDGRAHVIEEYYRRRVLQSDVVAEAKRLNQQYSPDVFVIDPSAAGLKADMRHAGLRVRDADNAVFEGIQTVKGRLAIAGDELPRLTISPSCANLIAEFESYSWKETKQSGVKDEPEKVNDHALDCLRYICQRLHTSIGTKSVKVPW